MVLFKIFDYICDLTLGWLKFGQLKLWRAKIMGSAATSAQMIVDMVSNL